MERIILTLALLVLIVPSIYAQGTTQPQPQTSPVKPTVVELNLCSKIYSVASSELFLETLSAINANKFDIEEIQSRSGYIIFTCQKKRFLVAISSIDKTHSMIKITPCDNNYYFPTGIITNIYKYLDINLIKPQI